MVRNECSRPFPTDNDVLARLTALCGKRMQNIRRMAQGGNNRLYRVEGASQRFAVKVFFDNNGEGSERLGREREALSFFSKAGIRNVPRLRHFDPDFGMLVFDWIEGRSIETPTRRDIDEALFFVRALWDAREIGVGLPPARQACLSISDYAAQIESRRRRLGQLAKANPELGAFLRDCFDPIYAATRRRALEAMIKDGYECDQEIPISHQMPSPSDFGFHNACRREDGSVVFLDFEYFGRDDPVRLASDFILHPGMRLSPEQALFFIDEIESIIPAQMAFKRRFFMLYPLVALRWSMIALNTFLPDHQKRQVFVGVSVTPKFLRHQLDKARVFVKMAQKDMTTSRRPEPTDESHHEIDKPQFGSKVA